MIVGLLQAWRTRRLIRQATAIAYRHQAQLAAAELCVINQAVELDRQGLLEPGEYQDWVGADLYEVTYDDVAPFLDTP